MERNVFIYFLTKLYSVFFFSFVFLWDPYEFAKDDKFNFDLASMALIAAEGQGAIALLPRKRFARVTSHPK